MYITTESCVHPRMIGFLYYVLRKKKLVSRLIKMSNNVYIIIRDITAS